MNPLAIAGGDGAGFRLAVSCGNDMVRMPEDLGRIWMLWMISICFRGKLIYLATRLRIKYYRNRFSKIVGSHDKWYKM